MRIFPAPSGPKRVHGPLRVDLGLSKVQFLLHVSPGEVQWPESEHVMILQFELAQDGLVLVGSRGSVGRVSEQENPGLNHVLSCLTNGKVSHA